MTASFITVVPSDTVDISRDGTGDFPNAFFVGTGGNVSLVAGDGSTAIFKAVNGQTLPFGGRRINQTNTTATDIVGVYFS